MGRLNHMLVKPGESPVCVAEKAKEPLQAPACMKYSVIVLLV